MWLYLRSTSGKPEPLGGRLTILSDKQSYQSSYTGALPRARSGYTHLYDAVDYGLNTVLVSHKSKIY